MIEERKADHMPRWPKPHIKKLTGGLFSPWVVIFTDPRYPHTRYWTGHHAHTVSEAWDHLPVMQDWHGYACSGRLAA